MTDTGTLPDSVEAGRQLAIAGLLGSIHGRPEDAELVGQAVDQLKAAPPRFALLRAVAHGLRGDTTLAEEMMERHSSTDDDRDLVMLASALMFGGVQWRPTLERLLASSADFDARSGAMRLMEFMDNLKSRRRRGY